MPEATLSISLRLARRDIEQLKARAHIRDMSAAHLDLAVASAGIALLHQNRSFDREAPHPLCGAPTYGVLSHARFRALT
jgi:hypothetical protein